MCSILYVCVCQNFNSYNHAENMLYLRFYMLFSCRFSSMLCGYFAVLLLLTHFIRFVFAVVLWEDKKSKKKCSAKDKIKTYATECYFTDITYNFDIQTMHKYHSSVWVSRKLIYHNHKQAQMLWISPFFGATQPVGLCSVEYRSNIANLFQIPWCFWRLTFIMSHINVEKL